MTDPTGHLVEFIDKNRIILGLVNSNKKGRLGLWTAQDRQEALPQGRILLQSPAALSPDRPRAAQVDYMRKVEARREELAAGVDVAELWELVHEESAPLPLQDLAELCFGAGAGSDQLSATLRALFNERQHFRLVDGAFLPLSAEQLENKLLQAQREAAQQAVLDQAVGFFKSLPDQGPAPGPAPEGLLEMLAELVIWEDEAPRAKKAKEIVAQADLGGKRQVFNLLVRLGYFAPHENLDLRREGLTHEFSTALEAQARDLAPFAGLDSGREDHTELYTFTIDGQYTTDFDDALSFEPLEGGGGNLGVHITDVAALLPLGCPLDQEACARGSSIYLPDNRIPMLPPRLSEDALSLREGQLRPAISFLARIDDQGEIQEFRLCRSSIRVTKRLTYDEADQLITHDPRLKGLYETCLLLRQRRGQAGAYFLPLPEVLVGVDEHGEVWVRRVERDGPAREMVAETAILANQLCGQHLAQEGVAALYRIQPPPREAFEEGDPSDLFLHFRQRRLLNRVEISTSPGRHSSLGVDNYTHATSPIRRYLDLVMQRQLGAVLAGQAAPFSHEELKAYAMQVEPTVRKGMKIRQIRHRYWLTRWLEARGSEPLEALVMEHQVKRWQLLITDIMLITTIPVEPGQKLEPGQKVMIKVVKADAFYDVLRVALA
ncbi:MAG: ribonuclease catalytic domain-containing protein [Pseudomonadota bacterium]